MGVRSIKSATFCELWTQGPVGFSLVKLQEVWIIMEAFFAELDYSSHPCGQVTFLFIGSSFQVSLDTLKQASQTIINQFTAWKHLENELHSFFSISFARHEWFYNKTIFWPRGCCFCYISLIFLSHIRTECVVMFLLGSA